MGERKLPDWFGETMRDFKIRKRREVRAALAAVSELNCGSAFAPNGKDVMAALALLRGVKERMSVKNWRPDAD